MEIKHKGSSNNQVVLKIKAFAFAFSFLNLSVFCSSYLYLPVGFHKASIDQTLF